MKEISDIVKDFICENTIPIHGSDYVKYITAYLFKIWKLDGLILIYIFFLLVPYIIFYLMV